MAHRNPRTPLHSLVFTIFAGLACATTPDRTAEATTVVAPAEMAALAVAHDAAWNAHDPAKLAALFVEDGALVTPGGKRVEGHAALLELFAAAGPTKQTQSSSQIDTVRSLGSSLALITMTQTLEGPGVAMLGSSKGRLVALTRRDDDQWRIVEGHVFAIPSAQGDAP